MVNMDLEFLDYLSKNFYWIILLIFILIGLSIAVSVHGKKVRLQQKKVVPISYGTELRLHMTDRSERVVTVLRVRKDGLCVREMFHGTYWLDFDEISMVWHEGNLHTVTWLRNFVKQK